MEDFKHSHTRNILGGQLTPETPSADSKAALNLAHQNLKFQVLFRYAIAIFKYTEDLLLRQTNYMSIVHTLRDRLDSLYDIEILTQVGQTAFKTEETM
jgi:hypothetical protein